MRASIVLPTYNERDTLPGILRRLAAALGSAGIGAEVVVVDDSSPDGTAEASLEAARELPLPVTVVRRPGKAGLASAVLEGVRRSQGEAVVVMDSDGSHPPELIPRLLGALEGGADIAVGSRYAPGGGVRGWPLLRRVLSWGATRIARAAFGLGVRDPVSGFFAARREVLSAGRPLEGIGYKILLEVLVTRPRAQVVEVPYVFVNRARGRSKLGTGEIYNYVRLVGRLLRRGGRGP